MDNLLAERVSFGEMRKGERGIDEFGAKRKDMPYFIIWGAI